jgi:Domain of unknown function (DUF6468)
MSEWIQSLLDIVLIGIVGIGLVQAARLMSHLVELRQSRTDMERFVVDFNATVMRAEAGIKGLRMAARESGDDLEKLVEKAILVRDELQFISDSADQIADRLSVSASSVMRTETKPESKHAESVEPREKSSTANIPARKSDAEKEESVPSSRAEKELLQALRKLS